jgi:phospholipid transport system substrate-binding protein
MVSSQTLISQHNYAARALRWFALVLVFALTVLFTPADAAERPDAERAKAFMNQLVKDAGAALTAKGQRLEHREQKFRALLRDGFDMSFIARVALGKRWRTLAPPEQKIYIDLFSRFVLSTYAPRLGGFDPARFHVTDASPKGRRDMLVKTDIEQDGGSAVKAGWRVRLVDGKHKIVDIIVEGISMTLNQRREFGSVVQKGGVSGLMEMLRARTERLSVEPPS